MVQINTGSISLSDHDADWFKVICGAEGNSTRSLVSRAVTDFVRRSKGEYMEIIEYAAAKHGLTFSEAFNRLALGQDLGDPLPTFEVKPDMEKRLHDTLEG